MFRLAIVDLLDGVSVEAEQDRARIAQNDRRVRRDEELRVTRCREVVKDLEEGELPLRRQGRFRLVQNIDPLLEPVGEEGDERFSMRLLVQRLAAVRPKV